MEKPFFTWKRPHRRARSSKKIKGTVAMEFALLSPALFLLMVGIIEISMMLLAQQVLENATFNATRTGKTGYVAAGMTQEQTIRAALASRGDFLLDMNAVAITSRAYDNLSGVGQPEPFVDANNNGVRDTGENYTDSNGNGQYDADRGANGFGDAQQVVVYTVTYPWNIMTPLMQDLVGEDGVLNLTAKILIRNEPYDNS
jgi:TadE-like protein